MPNHASTRERILYEGLDLVSTAGINGITLGVLAERTQMSKSGLFAHFGSKEDVQLGLLEQTAITAQSIVVAPAMRFPEGLPRLKAVVENWLGWTVKAGLGGGCPVAGGMFELDDVESPVRDRLLMMECHWRGFLKLLARAAVDKGEFRSDLDTDQFVWELCGIYLSHHASLRFVRDPDADHRARRALEALLSGAQGAAPSPKRNPTKNLRPRATPIKRILMTK